MFKSQIYNFLNLNREILNIRHINLPKNTKLHHVHMGYILHISYFTICSLLLAQNADSKFITLSKSECRNINRNLKNKFIQMRLYLIESL